MRRFATLFTVLLIGILSGTSSAQIGAPITTASAASLAQAAVIGHGEANDLAFAPNGKLLAAATSVGVIVTETGVPDATDKLSGSEFFAVTVDVSPDGSRVAAGGWDFSVRVWDIDTDALLLESREHGAAVNTVAFSPDGTTLASAGDDLRVLLWDAENLSVRATIDGLPAVIDRLAFSADGAMLAGIGRDGMVRIWESATGNEIAGIEGRSGALRALAFSPEGLLVFADDWGLITTWDATTDSPVTSIENGGVPVWDLAVTPDGRLVTVGGDETLRVRAMLTDVIMLERTNQPRNPLRAVAVAGDVIATASAQEISIWNADSEQPVSRLWLPGAAVSAAYSPSGDALAVATTDGNVTIYEADTFDVRAVANPERGAASALLYLPDGRLIAGWEDGFVTVIGPDDGALISSWPVHEGAVRGLMATGDENVVISAGADASIRFTHLSTGDGPDRTRDDGAPFTALAVDRLNRRLIVGSEAGMLSMFEIGQRRARPAGRAALDNNAAPKALAISPDGGTLLVGASDSSVRIYTLPDLTATGIITSFFGEPSAIRYGPDGSWFAVSSQDGYLRVFDAATQALLFEAHSHTDWATGLSIHPAGTSIVTTGEDGVARVWALP